MSTFLIILVTSPLWILPVLMLLTVLVSFVIVFLDIVGSALSGRRR